MLVDMGSHTASDGNGKSDLAGQAVPYWQPTDRACMIERRRCGPEFARACRLAGSEQAIRRKTETISLDLLVDATAADGFKIPTEYDADDAST
jgi:hypothetical protein